MGIEMSLLLQEIQLGEQFVKEASVASSAFSLSVEDSSLLWHLLKAPQFDICLLVVSLSITEKFRKMTPILSCKVDAFPTMTAHT